MPIAHLDDDLLPSFTSAQLAESRANDFVRLVSCLWLNATKSYDGVTQKLSEPFDLLHAAEAFAERWPRTVNRDLIEKCLTLQTTKSIVNPGTTTEPAWGAALAATKPFASAFAGLSLQASLIGKLTSAPRVPFGVSVPVATSGGTFRFVGQGAPKPVGNMQLASATLPILKAAGLIVVTEELMKLAGPSSVATLRREMTRGMAQYLDQMFTDPTVAAVANVSPASITNAAPSIASAGTSAANAVTDIKALLSAFLATNPDADSVAILMSPAVAVAMAAATNSQTLGPMGGTLFGVPVHTGAIGSRVIVLDPTALLVADDGDIDVSISRQTTIEMDTAPTSPVTASSVLVSLWQLNLVGLKIDRFINWKMARASAVAYTNVVYV